MRSLLEQKEWSRWMVAVASGAAVAIVLAGGYFAVRPSETHAAPVDLMENGAVVGQLQGPDAVAEASRKLGFAVRQPATFATSAAKLESVEARTGPAGLPGAMREAVLVYSADGTAGQVDKRALVVVRQANRPLTEGPGVAFDARRPGVRAWKLLDGEQAVYSFATDRETFILTYQVQLPSEDGVRQMFSSLR